MIRNTLLLAPNRAVPDAPTRIRRQVLTNATCKGANRGWMVTLVFAKEESRDSHYRVTVNGLEVPYSHYSANYVIKNKLSADLFYQGI